MKTYNRIKDIPGFPRGSVVAVGNFDGVHLGHQKLIKKMNVVARRLNIPTVILTFQRHPKLTLENSFEKQILTDLNQKKLLLKQYDITSILALSFPAWRNRSPEDFIKRVLVDTLSARVLFMGENFKFGKDRKGSPLLLKKLSSKYSYEVHIVSYKSLEGKVISSSLIRNELNRGRLKQANYLLGRMYSISGRVAKGTGRGKTLGFPTANINTGPLPLRYGVYAVITSFAGRNYKSIANYGTTPTFKERKPHLEIYIPHLTKNLYNVKMGVSFTGYIRPEKKFPDQKSLIDRIKKDLQFVENM